MRLILPIFFTVIALLIGCAPARDPTPGPATDASITAAVKARLLAESFTSALHIDVTTSDRVVTLSGKVISTTDRRDAARVARSVGGVRAVVDELVIQQNF